MRREGRGRYKPCRTGDRGSGAARVGDKTLDLSLQLRHRSVEGLAPRIDDYGPPWIHPIQIAADRLPHPAPDPVPHHGLTHRPRDSETDLRTVRLRLADEEGCKERTCKLGSLVINSAEVSGTQQANTFRKTGDGRLPLGADREFGPALSAAARQHGASILGRHAAAEAMRLGPAPVVRLKSTFRHSSSTI